MSHLEKTFTALAVAGVLGLSAGPAHAAISFELSDTWWFNPGGTSTAGTPDGQRVQKLLLDGYSHVDNTFGANTFVEQGLLKVTGWTNFLGQSQNVNTLFEPNASKDIYLAWNDLSGSFSLAGTSANISFDTGGIIKMFVDDTPGSTLLVTGSGTNASDDNNSYQNLSDGLTEIATFAVIPSAIALNSGVPTPESTGGTFDIALGQGVGNFLIWKEGDVEAGHFYEYDAVNAQIGDDLDTIDSDINASGDVVESGNVLARTSVDARLAPHSYTAGQGSTNPPGSRVGAGTGGDGQEEQFESAIEDIFGLGATPDYDQSLAGGNLEDFFVQHTGDVDLQTRVPEPGTILLMGLGLLGAGSLKLRRRA